MSDINLKCNSIILDTSAVVEYIKQTDKGAVVRTYLQNPENIIILPSVVIAELKSVLIRRKLNSNVINLLIESCTILDLTKEIALIAGELHSKLRQKNVSLADCIIMAHVEQSNSLLLTSDIHFKNFKNAILL